MFNEPLLLPLQTTSRWLMWLVEAVCNPGRWRGGDADGWPAQPHRAVSNQALVITRHNSVESISPSAKYQQVIKAE